jgi:hypothetical protein
MRPVAVELRKVIQIAAAGAAGLLVLSASRVPSQAQTSHMLVIPASDGYGFDDCLAGNKTCGHVIADAWCEAHGMSAAISFGRSDDITASIAGTAQPAKIAANSFIVNCKD